MLALGNFISTEDLFAPRKGAYQHDESGLGQVKIGDHGIDNFKPVARQDI